MGQPGFATFPCTLLFCKHLLDQTAPPGAVFNETSSSENTRTESPTTMSPILPAFLAKQSKTIVA